MAIFLPILWSKWLQHNPWGRKFKIRRHLLYRKFKERLSVDWKWTERFERNTKCNNGIKFISNTWPQAKKTVIFIRNHSNQSLVLFPIILCLRSPLRELCDEDQQTQLGLSWTASWWSEQSRAVINTLLNRGSNMKNFLRSSEKLPQTTSSFFFRSLRERSRWTAR